MENPELLQNLHRKLLKIAKEKNNSNEVLFIVDKDDFNKMTITLGEERSINPNTNYEAVSMMMKSKYESIYWVHNHTWSSDFSYDDIRCLYDQRVKAITMVTNKGKVCVLNKTKDYNIVKFYDTINKEKGTYDDVTANADKIAKAIIKRHSECEIEWIR